MSIASILASVLKPLLSTVDVSLESLKPQILASAKSANVSAVSVVKSVVDNALKRLPPAEAAILTPLFDTAFSTASEAIVEALGGEETALVNATLARAEQIINAL